MPTLRVYIKEFIVLGVLLLISVGIAYFAFHYFLDGRTSIDLWLEDGKKEYGLFQISLWIFAPLSAFIYGIRFIFARRRKLYTGWIAICYMLLVHLLINILTPVYSYVRLLFSDGGNIFPDGANMDHVRDDIVFGQAMAKFEQYKNEGPPEIFWLQCGLAVITVFLIALLIFEWRKQQKAKATTTN